ncbi:hypothetical protein OS493_027428 [Desmophyllum pertusum]|uniref:Peptidase C1A papain C-terminal domain-containing protein n=1 Tax=Desmophyllum pertusum TaxID=174260 RepID=A0A9X0CKF9_9CNID|nr:hypothetical protein OS493_027428 [Desmophyllum pertusum]
MAARVDSWTMLSSTSKPTCIDTEASYPYKAQDNKCHSIKQMLAPLILVSEWQTSLPNFSDDYRADDATSIRWFMDIKHKSEPDLQSAVATVGPISVAIDASHGSFQFITKESTTSLPFVTPYMAFYRDAVTQIMSRKFRRNLIIIYTSHFSQCSSTQLDHGVLAVGYGTYQGQDYWLVKNSWATSWGNQGYIMMSRNKNNQCESPPMLAIHSFDPN